VRDLENQAWPGTGYAGASGAPSSNRFVWTGTVQLHRARDRNAEQTQSAMAPAGMQCGQTVRQYAKKSTNSGLQASF